MFDLVNFSLTLSKRTELKYAANPNIVLALFCERVGSEVPSVSQIATEYCKMKDIVTCLS